MISFRDKYRIPSARATFWDYGNNAAYFVTICTRDREYYFGHVADGEMILSKIGETALTCWLDIPNHFPFVKLDAFIVMPNHIHGIIIIDKPDNNNVDGCHVETQNFASLRSTTTSIKNLPSTKNKFGPQSQNLASIIRGFKIGVTRYARLVDSGFAWQSRFHDHIIRNEQSWQIIREYVINNPINWNDDEFNRLNNTKGK